MVRAKVKLVFLTIVVGFFSWCTISPVAAQASSVSAPQPSQIISTKTGSQIKVYDTKALLKRKDVQVRTVTYKHVNISQQKTGIVPNKSLGGGADLGYYDLSINWTFVHGDYVCGYIATDTYSVSGPASGNLQADLFITDRGHDYEQWNYDKDFTTSLFEESPCWNIDEAVAEWNVQGSGALKWPDGKSSSSGPASVTKLESYP